MTNELQNGAVEWFVRMHAPQVTDSDRQAHSEWLSDPAHQQAYQLVEQKWQQLDNLELWAGNELGQLKKRADLNPDQSHARRRPALRVAGFMAAALAVMAILISIPETQQPTAEHYATVAGEQRRIVLADGSRIHLNSASSVEVQFDHKARNILLKKGEGIFDVASDPDRPFSVSAQGNKATALGTRYNVYASESGVAITVLEGRVAVHPAQQKEKAELLVLEAGGQARIDADGRVQAVNSADLDKLTSWDRGLLIFDGAPLREVAHELSRYIKGEIRVATSVPDYPVTGVIKLRDKQNMLDILSQVVPVNVKEISSELTMLFEK